MYIGFPAIVLARRRTFAAGLRKREARRSASTPNELRGNKPADRADAEARSFPFPASPRPRGQGP